MSTWDGADGVGLSPKADGTCEGGAEVFDRKRTDFQVDVGVAT